MSSRRHLRVVALFAALTVLAIACGDDGSDTADPPPTTEGSAPTTEGTTPNAATPEGGSGLAGTPAPDPLPERTKVVVTASYAIEPFSPLFLADEMGEFEKENLDVELVLLPPNEGTIQVATGRALLQVGGVGAAGFNAMESGTDIRYVANVHYQSPESQEGLWVRKEFLDSNGDLDAAKIPGMRLALGSGGAGSSVSTVPVEALLNEYGYTVNDVEDLPIGGPDMLVALEQGALDAGYLITPFWQQPSVAECCVLMTPQPPLAASVYVVNDDSLENEREVVTAVFRALMRTVRTYLQGDYHSDDEVMAVLSETFATPIDVLTTAPSLRFDPDLGLETEVLTEAQQVWIDLGDILQYDEPLPTDAVSDHTIIEEILSSE